ncbi:MAG: hypothetical protein COB36_10915 [Alphaproteobacteria bacterium]|nr:MAG: hypothetical protein COB36_10915 [Alphaproteobacteria bacterium]
MIKALLVVAILLATGCGEKVLSEHEKAYAAAKQAVEDERLRSIKGLRVCENAIRAVSRDPSKVTIKSKMEWFRGDIPYKYGHIASFEWSLGAVQMPNGLGLTVGTSVQCEFDTDVDAMNLVALTIGGKKIL